MSTNEFEASDAHIPEVEKNESSPAPKKAPRKKRPTRARRSKPKTSPDVLASSKPSGETSGGTSSVRSGSIASDATQGRTGRPLHKRISENSPAEHRGSHSLEEDTDFEHGEFNDEYVNSVSDDSSDSERPDSFEPESIPDTATHSKPNQETSSHQRSNRSDFDHRRSRHRGGGGGGGGGGQHTSQSSPSSESESKDSSDRSTGFGNIRFRVRQIIQQLQSTLRDLNEVLNLLQQAEKERWASEEEISSLRQELNQLMPRQDGPPRKRFAPKPHRRRGRFPNSGHGGSPQDRDITPSSTSRGNEGGGEQSNVYSEA